MSGVTSSVCFAISAMRFVTDDVASSSPFCVSARSERLLWSSPSIFSWSLPISIRSWAASSIFFASSFFFRFWKSSRILSTSCRRRLRRSFSRSAPRPSGLAVPALHRLGRLLEVGLASCCPAPARGARLPPPPRDPWSGDRPPASRARRAPLALSFSFSRCPFSSERVSSEFLARESESLRAICRRSISAARSEAASSFSSMRICFSISIVRSRFFMTCSWFIFMFWSARSISWGDIFFIASWSRWIDAAATGP